MQKNQSILFIVEKNLIDGKSYLGSSNDLLLIYEAVKIGLSVYLITPQEIIDQGSPSKNFPSKLVALKLSINLDQKKITNIIKTFWQKEVVNCLLTIGSTPSVSDKLASKELLLELKSEEIDLKKTIIFNRADPVSLSDRFYDLLIDLQKNGAQIIPDPYLNKNLGDKLAVFAIHYNLPIAGFNLLENIDLGGRKNEISFKTKIIQLSHNQLEGHQIAEFYDLLIAQDFSKVQTLFPDEYEIFIKGAKEYQEFHQELNNDSILKPANYFGGTGVVVADNQELNLNQAINNITKSFLAIKRDSGDKNIAQLSSIIIQERANMAHLGDLRIVFCSDKLQGIFVRVNPDFEKSKANNLHFGGHAESLFKNYEINKEGVDLMIADIKSQDYDNDEEIKKAEALYDLLEKIEFLKQIKILKQYPIIGIDALLSCDQNKNYKYAINEINLTSPMGQVQLLLLKTAVKFSELAREVLKRNDLEIILKKHQILADFFQNQNVQLNTKAKEILLSDQDFQKIIGVEIENILQNNFASETLNFIIKCKNH
jgi:hypothetical protein